MNDLTINEDTSFIGSDENTMNETLTNKQVAFILFGFIVGYGVMGLPKNVAENAGTGAWIALMISTFFAIMITYIILYLGYIHENKTLYEYSELLVGKFLTTVFVIIYTIEFFIFFTMITRSSSEIIRLTVLIKTPSWALCSTILLVVLYAVIKRLKVIARICEIYGIIIILTYIIVFFLISTQGNLLNIRPLFEVSNISTYLKASLVTTLPFMGMEILTVIPFSRKQNNKRVFKYAAFMMLFIGFLYIFAVESCISVMGVESIIHFKDSLLATVRRVDIRWLQFLRRLDGLMLVVWIMSIYCTLAVLGYGTVYLVNKLFKKANFNLLAAIIFTLSFIISQLPSSFQELEEILNYTTYIGILTGIFIPGLLLIVTKVKKYDKKVK
ncbi:GerAB/ArcD/ProY family transporter [Wukongibacter baidiensis]